VTSSVDASGRRLIHERHVECRGYLRADGLWDIEAQLADVKTHPVALTEGRTVAAGETYHGMMIRVTLDDDFTIREAELSMPHVPTSECRGAITAYDQLIGLRVGPGFTRRVKEMFGKTKGCIHLSELLLPIATTAFQTIPMARAMVAPRNAQEAETFPHALVELVDTCHALRASGPVALRLLKRS
jgi:hypothetical protein